MTAGDKVVARIPHKYNKVHRDRGEVFRLIDARNNKNLELLRYFVPFSNKMHEEIRCDDCGRYFSSSQSRDAHKRKPTCDDDSRNPTKNEVAEMIGADPDKFEMEDDVADQRTKDFSGEISTPR